jgi:membrane protease subunit HflC
VKAVAMVLAVLAILIGLAVLSGCFYTVGMTEAVIVTQFGRPVGEPIQEPGLHFKVPFVQTVNRIEKRVLEWDGRPTEMPTKDKTYIEVDAFGRWRIGDAGKYFVSLRDERSAQSRLDDILGSEIRAAVARHELVEIVRSDKARVLPQEAQLKVGTTSAASLPKIQRGRQEIENDILQASAPKLIALGIELLDVRFKRLNYNSEVLQRIYARMTSERQQIAQRFRSEGEGEAARILGRKERDLREVESNAYRQVLQLQGEADAEASRIYAEAFDKSPQAAGFYAFQKTMETYRKVFGAGTTMVLSTDSEFFRLLKDAAPQAR